MQAESKAFRDQAEVVLCPRGRGDAIHYGEGRRLILVLETLEKEKFHCQLDKFCEAKGSFAVQQVHASQSHGMDC